MVWCPFPDKTTARVVADALLDEGLAACANLMPGMTSVFVWNGVKEASEESGALFKTNAALLPRLIERLAALHPYEEPAILGWTCDAASAGTRAWLGAIAPPRA